MTRTELRLSYDPRRAAEMVLALMYLDIHDEMRVWKGYPWGVPSRRSGDSGNGS